MYKKIKGILFDFDGVIAESEQIWFGTALVTLKKMGMKYDRSIKQKSTIGIISEHLFQKLILEEDYNLTQVMRNYKKELKRAFDQQSPKIYPHLKKFIRSTNLKIGIVSNAHTNYITKVLKKKGVNLIKLSLNNKKEFNLREVFKKLYSLGIRNLLVEGGDKITKNMLKNRLINQFYLFESLKKLSKTKKHVIFTSNSILNRNYTVKSMISSKLAKDKITIYKR